MHKCDDCGLPADDGDGCPTCGKHVCLACVDNPVDCHDENGVMLVYPCEPQPEVAEARANAR